VPETIIGTTKNKKMKKPNNAIIGIYKITNPKGKVYIGQSVDIEKRWKMHKGLYESHESSKLKRSLVKYGVSEHLFEIIEECPVDQIYEREIHWIKFYNAVGDGLNILEGGQGVKMTDEIKNKISDKKKNHICYKDSERGEKISQSLKGRKNTWGKGKEKIGKKQEKEFREKLEKLKSKCILQFDDNGNLIQEWNSIKNAAESTGIHRENIGCVLRGITKTAGGYNWKYK